MSRQNWSKVLCAVRLAVPVVLAGGVLRGMPAAWGDAIWAGGTSGNAATDSDWGVAANWLSTSGSALPPGSGFVATPASGATTFIGNGGSVTSTGSFGISRWYIGYGTAAGRSNPGTGTVTLAGGVINTDQDSVMGDGAAGTLNVAGGTFYTKDTKHFFIGTTADATVNFSSGAMDFSRYGMEDGGANSVVNMSGGTMDFISYTGALASSSQVMVDQFNYSGGNLGGTNGIRTVFITSISGTGAITYQLNSGSTITINNSTDNTFSGTILPGTGGTAGAGQGTLAKIGPATLTLNNVLGMQRELDANGGAVVLDYASHPTDLINDQASISLGGGTVKFLGNGGTTTDLIGGDTGRKALRSVAGGSTVLIDPRGGNFTLDVRGSGGTNDINRGVGTTIDVSAVNGGTLGVDSNIIINSLGTGGVLKGVTVNGGTEFASNSTGAAGGYLVPLAAANYSTDTDVGTTTSTGNLKPTGAQTPITTAATFNAINLTGNVGITMGSGGSLTVNNGLIGNTTGTISGGTITSSAGSDLVVVTPQNLTIASNIVDSATTTLTKAGSGTLVLSGANSYAGSTNVDGGTLQLGSAAALPANAVVNISNTPGAALDLAGNSVTVAGLMTAGLSTTSLNSSASVQPGQLGAAGGEVKLGGATLAINLGSGANVFIGTISGNGGVAKQGGGDLLLAGKNTYTGVTTVSGGTLYVTSLADGGQPSSLGAGSSSAGNLVIDGGTLRSFLSTPSSTNRLFSIGPAGATLSGGGNPKLNSGYFGPLRFTATGTLGTTGSPSARTLTLDAGATGMTGTTERALTLSQNLLAATIADSGAGNATSVTKTGVGNWLLTGASTYTGATIINAGMLQVMTLSNSGSPGPLGAASSASGNLVLGGGTLQYLGSGSSTDRLFNVGAGGNTGIDSSGTGPVNFTNTGATGGGSGTLVLSGSNTGANTLAANVSLGVSLAKSGTGTWLLTGASTYSGTTTVSGGVLQVRSLANGGSPSNIGQSSNANVNLVLSGGTLQYVGSGSTSDRLFTLSASSTLDSSGTGPLNLNNTGAMGVFTTTGTSTVTPVLTLAGSNAGANTLATAIGNWASGSNALAKSGSGTWIVTGANTYTGATTVNQGKLVLGSSAWAPVLNNAGGANVRGGSMVFDYTGTSSPQSTVVPLLTTSHGNGGFNNTGQIRSSTADANHGLGWYDDGASKLTVAYTWYGDVNLDGTVNADDYALLDRAVAKGLASSSPIWVNGDFNYDGVVNSADYLLMDTSYGKISGQLPESLLAEREAQFGPAYVAALTAAVPEPAAIGLLAGALPLVMRRRRNVK